MTVVADALLDTTSFIDYHRGDPGARALWLEIADGTLSAAVSPITVFELWLGTLSREEELTYRAMPMALDQVPFGGAEAEAAALWLRNVSPRASETVVRDAFFAATAMLRREPVCTRNVRDFRRFYSNVRSY